MCRYDKYGCIYKHKSIPSLRSDAIDIDLSRYLSCLSVETLHESHSLTLHSSVNEPFSPRIAVTGILRRFIVDNCGEVGACVPGGGNGACCCGGGIAEGDAMVDIVSLWDVFGDVILFFSPFPFIAFPFFLKMKK